MTYLINHVSPLMALDSKIQTLQANPLFADWLARRDALGVLSWPYAWFVRICTCLEPRHWNHSPNEPTLRAQRLACHWALALAPQTTHLPIRTTVSPCRLTRFCKVLIKNGKHEFRFRSHWFTTKFVVCPANHNSIIKQGFAGSTSAHGVCFCFLEKKNSTFLSDRHDKVNHDCRDKFQHVHHHKREPRALTNAIKIWFNLEWVGGHTVSSKRLNDCSFGQEVKVLSAMLWITARYPLSSAALCDGVKCYQ